MADKYQYLEAAKVLVDACQRDRRVDETLSKLLNEAVLARWTSRHADYEEALADIRSLLGVKVPA